MHTNIALFYGSSTCYTEMAAEKISTKLAETTGPDTVDMFNVADTDLDVINDYTHIIMGIPTWDYGELQEDWEALWDTIDTLNLDGKTIALFGLGDQIGYPQWFQDAMGYLHDKLVLQGATMVGYWPVEGYTFEASQALTEDEQKFVGLALDEENEFDKTEQRILTWSDSVLRSFGFID